MARIRREARLSVSRATGLPLREVRGMAGTIVYRGTNTPATLEQYSAPGTQSGIPMANPVVVTDDGFIPGFDAVGDLPDILYLDWVSGPWVIPVNSVEGLTQLAEEMATLARTAVDLADVKELFAGTGIAIEQVAGGFRISATITGGGGGGGGAPAAHTHVASDISDASAAGLTVLRGTPAQGRGALEAGQSNVTVNGTYTGAAAPAASTVNLTGSQTISGSKTFTSAPQVPDASFSITKTAGLRAELDAAKTGSSAADAVKANTAAYRFRTNNGTGPWEPRPTGYKLVIAFGVDPSPADQQPGDLRDRPVDA